MNVPKAVTPQSQRVGTTPQANVTHIECTLPLERCVGVPIGYSHFYQGGPVYDRPHSAFILISAYQSTYMPYACKGMYLCRDAFHACIHSIGCLLAGSFGPSFICVSVWHVSCPRGQVRTVRQHACICYCAPTLPYPSNETRSSKKSGFVKCLLSLQGLASGGRGRGGCQGLGSGVLHIQVTSVFQNWRILRRHSHKKTENCAAWQSLVKALFENIPNIVQDEAFSRVEAGSDVPLLPHN